MARSRGRGERELPEAPPQNDAYTGLLAISLLATITGLIFVAMDWSDYKGPVPKPTPPASISQAEPEPAGANVVAPQPVAPAPVKKGTKQ
jgi:hypothetical protein